MVNLDRNSVPAPTIERNYRTQAVYEALEKIFFNKCYLCERLDVTPRSFAIEHFRPHRNDDALKYAWDNLYLACHDTCNLYKGTLIDILDPCHPDHDVENDIVYELTDDFTPRFYAADPKNQTIVNTCTLLDKIHNGHNPEAQLKTSSLRYGIDRQAKRLQKAMLDYYRAANHNDTIDQQRTEQAIKAMVSRKAPYTMLMRSLAKQYRFDHLFD